MEEKAEFGAAASSGFALDPDIARIVDAMGQSPAFDLDALPLEEALARVRFGANSPLPANAEDRQIDMGSERTMRVRLYYPDAMREGLPVLMHLHGGGFVAGTVEMDDKRCCRLARDAQCIVASVDYPLAPEHPFPVPIEDAFTAWLWLIGRAQEFGGDARRIAVSGSSAGGHLAVGVCCLARDRGAQAPLLQLLAYPVIDPAMASASYRQFAAGPFLTKARMAWFWKQYTPRLQPDGPLWSPLTGSLAGLPPAHVMTAEFDVLRDEAEEYAAKLRAAGGRARVHRYKGMIHGFLTVAPDHRDTSAAFDESASVLRAAFAEALS